MPITMPSGMPSAMPQAAPTASRTMLSCRYSGRMPFQVSETNDCHTSPGPGRNTRGKISSAVTIHHAANSGMNGTIEAIEGQRAVRRT
jgi:hypothetical protein